MTLVVDVSCRGSSDTRRFLLAEGDELVIGRANEELDLHRDRRLSRKHFILRYADRQIEITHLSKTNPTMVAAVDSKDFLQVEGKHIEAHSCKIMAGSHRFVAVIEAPNSVIDPTPSADVTAQIWVGDDDVSEPLEECPLPPECQTFVGDPMVAAEVPAEVPAEKPQAGGFAFSDSVDESFLDDAPVEEPVQEPKAEPRRGSDVEPKRKMTFPLDDDFFD